MLLRDTDKSTLRVLCAYGLTFLAAIGGIVLRFAVHLPGEVSRDASHCYIWQPWAVLGLGILVTIAPPAVAFTQKRLRVGLFIAIPLCALVLATFLWSYTVLTPCTNEF